MLGRLRWIEAARDAQVGQVKDHRGRERGLVMGGGGLGQD